MDRKIEAEVNGEQPEGNRLQIDPEQSRISYWVKLAETGFSGNFGKILEDWDLIPSEWAVMRELYRPGWRGTVEFAQGKAEAQQRAEAEALSNYCKKVAEAAAREFFAGLANQPSASSA